MADNNTAFTPDATSAERQVMLQKIYVKDASLEVPSAPAVFTRQANPQVDVNIANNITALGGENYQVILTVTVTALENEETLFLAEVQQAGIFLVQGFGEAELPGLLAGYCPEILFPFAREVIANLTGQAGFTPVMLQPINFNALYQAHLQQQAANGMAGNDTAALGGPDAPVIN